MNIINIVIKLLLIFLLINPAYAKRIHKEKYYQDIWCKKHNGTTRYRTKNRKRPDCVTNTHAIEFDFHNKPYEAIGQALMYGLEAGKRPGIVLIIEKPQYYKYFIQMNSIIAHYYLPIDTCYMSLNNMECNLKSMNAR